MRRTEKKRKREEKRREEKRRDETRRDETRRDETRQDETRRDETRRDATRNDAAAAETAAGPWRSCGQQPAASHLGVLMEFRWRPSEVQRACANMCLSRFLFQGPKMNPKTKGTVPLPHCSRCIMHACAERALLPLCLASQMLG